MVITALAAGAGAGVKDTATTVVKDAYAGLKGVLAERFRGRHEAEIALREHETSPETWRASLTGYVQEVGVDGEMLLLAQRLLEATKGISYPITTDTIQGLQQGNYNTQTNTFGR